MNNVTHRGRSFSAKKIASLALCAAMTASAFAAVGAVSANGVSPADYGLAENIEDGTILHCFDWKLSDIKAELPNIAKAGFTSVQTSPLQGSPNQGVWYWLYQPLGFEIKDTGLGGEQELKELCQEADKYGIKVIVDVVANHLAGNNRDQLQKPFDDNAYWHMTGKDVSDSSRIAVTTYDLGKYGDLKSEDSTVINAAKTYVETLQADGVDGIRWDAAKHIALPSEGCDFWNTVTNNSLFHYGEILGSPGGASEEREALMKEYIDYMNVTDSSYGDNMLSSFKNGKAPANDGNWVKKDGITGKNLVYWGESHDTYANKINSGSNGVDQNYVDRAYAVGAARNSVSLYLSRPLNSVPDQMMYAKKGSMHFTSAEVAAVNHFHNAAGDSADAYEVTDNVSVVTRDGVGAVIVLGEGGNKDVTVKNVDSYVPAGTYKDEVTGNEFTVTDTEIKGKVGSTGIAVVYNSAFAERVEASVETGTSFEGSLDVTLRAIGVTDASYQLSYEDGVHSFTDGQTIKVGEKAEGGKDIILTLKGKNASGDEVTAEYVYTKKEIKDVPKLTKGGVIFDNSIENWSKVNVYVYDERTTVGTTVTNGEWPGVAMTDAGDGLYTYEFPDKFADCKNIMIIFNNGSGNQLPAKDGFLCGYDEVGLYTGESKLKVVQTIGKEESSKQEEESSKQSSEESSKQSSEESSKQSSQESSKPASTAPSTSSTSSTASTANTTTTTTTTATTTTNTTASPVVATGDSGSEFAVTAFAVLAALSCAAAFAAYRKKEN